MASAGALLRGQGRHGPFHPLRRAGRGGATQRRAASVSLAPGVIDTDMQAQLRGADAGRFPDRGTFVGMKDKGMLSSPPEAAARVLAFLARADFGSKPVADVRD